MKTKTTKAPAAGQAAPGIETLNVSVANERAKPYGGAKTSGVQMRGTGAATKGKMSRGPMG
jgi:hypothetical protein